MESPTVSNNSVKMVTNNEIKDENLYPESFNQNTKQFVNLREINGEQKSVN